MIPRDYVLSAAEWTVLKKLGADTAPGQRIDHHVLRRLLSDELVTYRHGMVALTEEGRSVVIRGSTSLWSNS